MTCTAGEYDWMVPEQFTFIRDARRGRQYHQFEVQK